MPLDSVLAFHNLELEFKNPGDDWKGTWIMEFLHCVPNLKTLILDFADVADADEGFEPLPEEVPSCLLYRIKKISILTFKGDIRMFEMISYFLNHALVLEKLMIIINVWGTLIGYRRKSIEFTKEFKRM
ncbi:hypothetical protein F3Y22_tig00112114pilonHSYRG00214 [Hibiscus syriacus]|uniref:FBD domain-containing protein n=1 Tax=Hibiscus syriacus TaxID=106335 RepID=A0A6A2X716_HIBSY|nr:hypothetical protein F3Y22_tig00112114pilonHSYRG00214 [Hibiscus syriacus]